jgi:hypothetical protein
MHIFSFRVSFLGEPLKSFRAAFLGKPQWGQVGACSDMLLPHSGHVIKAIFLPPLQPRQ